MTKTLRDEIAIAAMQGALEKNVASIIKDLCWARIDKNGAPYIDQIEMAAQAVVSHMSQEIIAEKKRRGRGS